MIGPVAFTSPLLLLTLVLLPILWWLLRAVPPAPILRRFPGVALLIGLKDEDSQSDKTPWWLLLLRILAVAAAIVGFAGPVLNPQQASDQDGPLLVLMDGSWASARDWPARLDRARALIEEAGREGRPVALVQLTDLPPVGDMPFQSANVWIARLDNLTPAPFAPDMGAGLAWAEGIEAGVQTFWFSDGLAHEGRAALLDRLQQAGPVAAFEGRRSLLALGPPRFEDGVIRLAAQRLDGAGDREVTVQGFGLDPAGIERELARGVMAFAAGDTVAELELELPPELRNRMNRFEIAGERSAGAVTLTDDALQRRQVGLIAGTADQEGQELLSPLHYLRQALAPTADLLEVALADMLLANPDVIILADVARLSPEEDTELQALVDRGGMLVRFAGPRLAGSDLARETADPLMPVRLREGGRTVGGAMSWGEPKALRVFDESSPFFRLPIPEDVLVSAQVLAQPDPELAERTIAALADGTPLVTRSRLGQGQVVLFHVTANAEWSSLPLSGLFVQMLERLAISTRPLDPDAADLAGTTWVPDVVLDAYGQRRDAENLPGVAGADLANAPLSATLLPGLYSGSDRRVARNVIALDTVLTEANWPSDVPVEGLRVIETQDLSPYLLVASLVLLLIDSLAALWLSGRLTGVARGAAILMAALLAHPSDAQDLSDDDILALLATSEITLGYVLTGDEQLDETSRAGLWGLGLTLTSRTSVEPAAPIGVDLESDELVFFPLIYWPISVDQPIPSDAAYARLNAYLRGGGMIVFDTRDSDVGAFGAGTPNGRRLRELAQALDIPPLEPIPDDHVLTRAFYLLQDFPGRHLGRDVWVEAAPPDAEQVEGMPFRNLNDGVTPVIIGGNDWAAAWAMTPSGQPMFPVGRGFTGERQREIALRFGVNLVMHVLSGNYKSDQVHVPALLERLGQ
ncbi:DUF4159 domain-containing protein [Nioella aestuarii]|uniref:DUF4159 domain-containing protein n=1 Tax=Nioella aestuarii TaxID=1662864 RepID=UPI003D7FB579